MRVERVKKTHTKVARPPQAQTGKSVEPKFFSLEEKVQTIYEQSQAIVARLNAMHDRLNGAGQDGKCEEQAYPPIGVAASDTLNQLRYAHELITTISEHLFTTHVKSGKAN